jgi:cation diffusion facilitator family transporter
MRKFETMTQQQWIFKRKTMLTVVIIGIVLMIIKFVAFFITRSNAILTDALESIVNVVAGGFALYSLYYSAQPKDEDHPYGHGKIEYLSSGLEGGLITISGVVIIIKSIYSFFYPEPIQSLDIGLYLTLFAGACNFVMGRYLIRHGKANHSTAMVADGKHLQSDTVSSIAIGAGLAIIYFTKVYWLDNVMGILAGGYICFMGYRLLKEAVTSLLDEADVEKLNMVIDILNKSRREKWIDMHNLRVLKYGSHLHVDAHITLPWYDKLEDAHTEVSLVENLIKKQLGVEFEFFIHADPCIPTSCPICMVHDCPVRKAPFVRQLTWTLENVLPNEKHML